MKHAGRRHLLAALASAALTAGALFVMRPLGPLPHLGPFLLVAAAGLLFAAARWADLKPSWRAVFTGMVMVLALVQGLRTTRHLVQQANDPPEWDFSSFWIAGRVAVAGRDFYHPGSFDDLVAPLDPSPEFRAEILDVGFWYPPPTMLMLLPIGSLDLGPAARVWFALNGLAIAADIVLVWWIFLRSMGWTGGALAAALVALMPGTDATIHYGQSNAIALLWLLLCWKDRGRMRGGVWLVLAAVTKPIAACLLLYVVLRRHWRMLGGAFVGAAAALAATTGFFGWQTTVNYVRDNPLVRLPDYVYTQTVNQSLPAAILRLTGTSPGGASPLHHPGVMAAVAVVLLVSVWRVLAPRSDDRAAFAIVLAGGLLVYPATLTHYSMLAILPILSLWACRDGGVPGAAFVAALAGIVYATSASGTGSMLPVYLVVWAGTILFSFVCAPAGRAQPASSA